MAIITIIEWNSLDRDPVRQEILSPFIERQIDVSLVDVPTVTPSDLVFQQDDSPDAKMRYDVEFHFNGPLFLACFFVPVLIVHGIGLIWRRIRQT